MKKEFCFAVIDNPNTNEDELKFILGDDVIMIDDRTTMADILTMLEIYTSKSKAKKDGWNQPLPFGFWDKQIGKTRTRITIWNPNKPL